jgi:hypothetical protein
MSKYFLLQQQYKSNKVVSSASGSFRGKMLSEVLLVKGAMLELWEFDSDERTLVSQFSQTCSIPFTQILRLKVADKGQHNDLFCAIDANGAVHLGIFVKDVNYFFTKCLNITTASKTQANKIAVSNSFIAVAALENDIQVVNIDSSQLSVTKSCKIVVDGAEAIWDVALFEDVSHLFVLAIVSDPIQCHNRLQLTVLEKTTFAILHQYSCNSTHISELPAMHATKVYFQNSNHFLVLRVCYLILSII